MSILNFIKRIIGLRNYERITEPFRHPKGWLLYQYVQLFPNIIIKKSNRKPIAKNTIVSLTTYGERKEQVQWTILSIINGTLLPESVHLYVSSELLNYFTNSKYILSVLIKNGILKIFGVQDLGPFTKLYYALYKLPQKNIVIADDDILYHKKWLHKLYDASKTLPNTVVASRIHKINFNNNNFPKPYLQWEWEWTQLNTNSGNLFPTGIGGILFPPNSFSNLVLNKEIFLSLCPTADDVWWWFCLVLNNTRIKGIQEDGKPFKPLYYESSKNEGLNKINVTEGANDKQIQALINWKNHEMDIS